MKINQINGKKMAKKNQHYKTGRNRQNLYFLTIKVKVTKRAEGIRSNKVKGFSELHVTTSTYICLKSRILSLFRWIYERKQR